MNLHSDERSDEDSEEGSQPKRVQDDPSSHKSSAVYAPDKLSKPP